VLVSFDYLERERLLVPEYFALLLFATLGMMLMIGGDDLMVVFLGLELMSVAVYALAGINRHSAASAEAANSSTSSWAHSRPLSALRDRAGVRRDSRH